MLAQFLLTITLVTAGGESVTLASADNLTWDECLAAGEAATADPSGALESASYFCDRTDGLLALEDFR